MDMNVNFTMNWKSVKDLLEPPNLFILDVKGDAVRSINCCFGERPKSKWKEFYGAILDFIFAIHSTRQKVTLYYVYKDKEVWI